MTMIDQMRFLTQVVGDGSFTAAARNLGISVANVSRAVTALETSLETRLLHRTKRSISLTEAGKRYVERCRSILNMLDIAEAEARDARRTASGTLNVGSTLAFGDMHIVPSVLEFHRRIPTVAIDLTFSDSPLELVSYGADTAFVLSPSLPNSGLVAHWLGNVECIACASPTYLERHGMPTTISALAGHSLLDLVVPSLNKGIWTYINDGANAALTARAYRLSFNHERPLMTALHDGFGIGLVPTASALPGLQSNALVRILPRLQFLNLNLFVVYQSRLYLEAKLRTWLEFIRETMPAKLEEDQRRLKRLTRAGERAWEKAAVTQFQVQTDQRRSAGLAPH